MSEQVTQMSVPVDGDGFLRRECPTCEREFKWFASAEGEGVAMPDGGYYCPYCAIQAPADSWFTRDQLELAKNTLMREVVGPELENLAGDLRRSSVGGLVRFDVKLETPEPLDPLVEPNDMRRFDFECHPSEPVKVLDDWVGPVHCLICASAGVVG